MLAGVVMNRRLSRMEYNNTVRDLLGDYSRPAQRFPVEDYVDGFKNQTRYQGMPPVLVDAYSTSAEKLALNAFRAGDINDISRSLDDKKWIVGFVIILLIGMAYFLV